MKTIRDIEWFIFYINYFFTREKKGRQANLPYHSLFGLRPRHSLKRKEVRKIRKSNDILSF